MKLCRLVCTVALMCISVSAYAKSATNERGNGCKVANGELQMISANNARQSLIENAERGILTYRCIVFKVSNPTGKKLKFNYKNTGKQCITSHGSTKRWQQSLSPKGKAELICEFNLGT